VRSPLHKNLQQFNSPGAGAPKTYEYRASDVFVKMKLGPVPPGHKIIYFNAISRLTGPPGATAKFVLKTGFLTLYCTVVFGSKHRTVYRNL
jgi:hypothetical protein